MVEFIGTLALITLAASTSIFGHTILGLDPYKSHILIGITVFIVVGLSTILFGEISGAHINPSISLSFLLSGQMPRKMFLPYIGAQLSAALISGIMLRLAFSSLNSTDFGSTKIQEGATPLTGTFLEMLGTFFLAYVALMISTRFKGKPREQSLLGGATIFLLTLIIGPFTGASFSLARSLGPAIASMHYDYLYIYLIGPLAGSALAGIVFRLKTGLHFRTSGRTSAATFKQIKKNRGRFSQFSFIDIFRILSIFYFIERWDLPKFTSLKAGWISTPKFLELGGADIIHA